MYLFQKKRLGAYLMISVDKFCQIFIKTYVVGGDSNECGIGNFTKK